MGTGNHGDDLYKCINWLLNIYRLRTASECARVLLFVTEQYRRNVPGLWNNAIVLENAPKRTIVCALNIITYDPPHH